MVTFTRSPKGKHHLIPRLDYRDQKMREVVQWHHLLSSADKLASDTGWNIRAFWEAVEDGDFPRADHVFRGAVQAHLNARTDGEVFIERPEANHG